MAVKKRTEYRVSHYNGGRVSVICRSKQQLKERMFWLKSQSWINNDTIRVESREVTETPWQVRDDLA